MGDVKQAIFTWREGDPRLFRDILERYNHAAPGTIVEEHLARSWRSGPAIIELVNAAFGRGDVMADLFPGPASPAWNRDWLLLSRLPLASRARGGCMPARRKSGWRSPSGCSTRSVRRGADWSARCWRRPTRWRRRSRIICAARAAFRPRVGPPRRHRQSAGPAARAGRCGALDTQAREHVAMTLLAGCWRGRAWRSRGDYQVCSQIHADGFAPTLETGCAGGGNLRRTTRFASGAAIGRGSGVADATGSCDVGSFSSATRPRCGRWRAGPGDDHPRPRGSADRVRLTKASESTSGGRAWRCSARPIARWNGSSSCRRS